MGMRFSTPRVLGFSWGTSLSGGRRSAPESDKDFLIKVVGFWVLFMLLLLAVFIANLIGGQAAVDSLLEALPVIVGKGLGYLFIGALILAGLAFVVVPPVLIVVACFPKGRAWLAENIDD